MFRGFATEFRIGDDEDELGFIDRRYAPAAAGNPRYVEILDQRAATQRLASSTSS